MFASDLRSQIASTTLLACGKGRNGITNGSGSGTIMGPTLRDYQVKGVEWMNALYLANSNGILADEMGLGTPLIL